MQLERQTAVYKNGNINSVSIIFISVLTDLKVGFFTADQSRGSDDSTEISGEDEEIKEEKEEDKPSETLPLETLFSGISLISLTDAKKHDVR